MVENVKNYLNKYGLKDRLIELNEDTSTCILAAKALGCTSDEIAKTMAFMVDNTPIVIVLAGDHKIDNHKYKDYFNCKATMVKKEQLPSVIGHSMGGVCPFCLKEKVKIYLDNSLKKYQYVYPAGGSSNSAVKLTIKELESIINNPVWIDVVKYEEEN